MFLPTLFFITLAAACTCHLLTLRVRRYLLAKQVMDKPNERSMHSVPVPRGGGLAVVATIGAGLLLMLDKTSLEPTLLLLAALALLVTISWMDDRRSLGAGIRLATHLLAALIGSFALDSLGGDQAMVLGGALPFWLDRLLLVLGWGWFMNLTNFMDGIDGITGMQTAFCAAGVGLLLYPLSSGESLFPLLLAVLVCGAALGFLKMNWHPAQIFLGDVGSVPLGFVIGFLLLNLACAGHLVPALLLPLYYLADSGITITRRALRREKIWQPHRSHFYQRATSGTGSPVPVVLWIAAGNVFLLGSAYVAMRNPWLGLALGVGVLGLLLAKLSLLAKGNKE